MAFGNFGQAWRQSAFSIDPDEKLHIADPAHFQPSSDPNPVWQTPAEIVSGDGQPEFIFADSAYGEDWVADNAGQVFSSEPYSHEYGSDTSPESTLTEAAASNAGTAGRDTGTSVENNYQPPMVQDHTTVYIGKRFEGLGSTEVSTVALQRGLNSLEQNNPEGFRRGWVEQTWVDRKFQIGERTHDRRWVQVNTAYVEPNQESVPGPYGSPFDTLARQMSSISQNPMMRREPVSISESVTTDGSEQTYASDVTAGDWVAG